MSKLRFVPDKWIILLFLLGLLSISCSEPFLDSMRTVVSRESGPVASCELRYGYGISPKYAIVFTFSHAMDPSSLKVGGTMAAEAVVSWPDSQTLRIAPATAWQVADDRTVQASCSDYDGYGCQIDRVFSILDGTIHVSPDGVPWNSGTKNQPLGAVEAASTMAAEMYPEGAAVEIRLAGGSYYPNFTKTDQALVLGDNQTWKGGYLPDFSARDPVQHPSLIDAHAAIGNAQQAICIRDVTHSLTFDGIGVRSPEGDGSTCILVLRSKQVTLSNVAMDNLSSQGYVLALSDCQGVTVKNCNLLSSFPVNTLLWIEKSADITIQDNQFEALSSNESTGIYVDATTSLLIERNHLKMGLGPQYSIETTVGIWLFDSDPVIRNNIIDAGTGRRRIAFRNQGASPLILNNTCYAGTNTMNIYDYHVPCLVENDTDGTGKASQPIIINNLLMSGGMLSGEFIEGSTSTAVNHNSFSFFSSNFLTGFYLYLLDPFKADNDIRTDLWAWLTKPDWKLMSTAPAVLRNQGADLTPYGFTDDIAGNPRPAGAWSMGAWQ